MSYLKEFTKVLLKKISSSFLAWNVSYLAITTEAINGLGMGLNCLCACMFKYCYLALKNIIPKAVKLPAT